MKRFTAVALLALAITACHRDITQITNVNVAGSDTTTGGNTNGNTGNGNGSCPAEFQPCTGVKFGSGGFHPADTTIVITTRYHVTGTIFVPTGMTNTITVLSTKQCAVPIGSVAITSTVVANVYSVDIVLQGIATCRDSIAIKFDANSVVQTFVHVTVIAGSGSSGTTITMTPPGGSGNRGDTLQATCVITGATDKRCRWYSTDPSRIDVIAGDTTFANFTNPWKAGAHKAGQIDFFFPGSAQVCAYWVPDPKVAVCNTFTTLGASGDVIDLGAFFQPLDWRKGVELKIPR